MKLIVDSLNVGKRLDVFLSEKTEYSRNFLINKIKSGCIKVDDKIIDKPSYKISLDSVVQFDDFKSETLLDVREENISLDILYEDLDILIINKPRGMVVHPAPGHKNGTLVNAIMFHCKNNLSGINGVIRPGIVHRIDKDTSGVLCICKNDFSHNNISKQFQEHTNIRKYVAIVKGLIKEDAGTIDNFLNRDKKNRLRMAVCDIGKRAITKYKIIERFKNHTYIECELLTGRTHQIRAHMRHIGHPLLGDLLYGGFDDKFKNLDGQILHANYLEITHPKTNERISFTAEIPEYFREILNKIKKI